MPGMTGTMNGMAMNGMNGMNGMSNANGMNGHGMNMMNGMNFVNGAATGVNGMVNMNGMNSMNGMNGMRVMNVMSGMNGAMGGNPAVHGMIGGRMVSMPNVSAGRDNSVLTGTIDPNTFNIYHNTNGNAPNSTLIPPHLNSTNGANATSTNMTNNTSANNSNNKLQKQLATTATLGSTKSSGVASLQNDDPGIDIDPFFDFGAEFDAAKDSFYTGAGDDEAGEEDDDDDEYVEEKKIRRAVKGKNVEKGGKGAGKDGGGKRGKGRTAARPAKSTPTPATDPGPLIGEDGMTEFGSGSNVPTPELADGVVKRKRGRPPGSGKGRKKKVVDPNYE